MPEKWTGEIVGGLHVIELCAKDLAEYMGIHPKYVSRVLNGHRKPKNAESRFKKALQELTEQYEKTA